MYGIRYKDGVDDWSYSLDALYEDYTFANEMALAGRSEFSDATPVVQVGTNPDDLQWETFSDAPGEVPDEWFYWLATK